MANDEAAVLASVGPRLRGLREQRGTTLAQLAEITGISISTLSRLESGGRKATLELLLPLARGLQPFKQIFPPNTPTGQLEQQTHEGYEWLYVLSGGLRLLLGEH
jgi:transcriptional regulator with XRE-family HTH domain